LPRFSTQAKGFSHSSESTEIDFTTGSPELASKTCAPQLLRISLWVSQLLRFYSKVEINSSSNKDIKSI
jgi:hypothetical protein